MCTLYFWGMGGGKHVLYFSGGWISAFINEPDFLYIICCMPFVAFIYLYFASVPVLAYQPTGTDFQL